MSVEEHSKTFEGRDCEHLVEFSCAPPLKLRRSSGLTGRFRTALVGAMMRPFSYPTR